MIDTFCTSGFKGNQTLSNSPVRHSSKFCFVVATFSYLLVCFAGESTSRSKVELPEKYRGRELSIAEILSFDDDFGKKKTNEMRTSKKIAKRKGKKR